MTPTKARPSTFKTITPNPKRTKRGHRIRNRLFAVRALIKRQGW